MASAPYQLLDRPGELLALSVFKLDTDGDLNRAKGVETFLEEVQLLSALSHPHVLGVVGWYSHQGEHAMLTPRMPKSLYKALHVDKTAFSGGERLRLMHELWGAVAYIHGEGVQHQVRWHDAVPFDFGNV